MAHAINKLGWTKIFFDNRDNIPLPAMPLFFTSDTHIPRKQQYRYTLEELIPLVTSVGKEFNFPIGHQVLVANSKSGLYTTISAGGRRPVVDRMAANLIDDIVSATNEVCKAKGATAARKASVIYCYCTSTSNDAA